MDSATTKRPPASTPPATRPARAEINEETPRLVHAEAQPGPTIVTVRGESIGGGEAVAIIAGPCAVESRDQIMQAAEIVSAAGVRWFRAGAFKPRTSPYSFQGLGDKGLRLLGEVREQFDLRIVTEAMDAEMLPAVAEVADVVQIGSRNMHNYRLLEAAGRIARPVLLKRGMSATIQEWLLAAEYILAAGNREVILCERGIRTFEPMTRNTLDLAGAIMAKGLTHLPVVVDPSHGVGVAGAIPALAVASAVSGVDGVMIEMHPDPSQALSDKEQALGPEDFRRTVSRMRAHVAILRRSAPE